MREVKVIGNGFEFDYRARSVAVNTTEGKSLGIKIEDGLPKYTKENLQGMLTNGNQYFRQALLT